MWPTPPFTLRQLTRQPQLLAARTGPGVRMSDAPKSTRRAHGWTFFLPVVLALLPATLEAQEEVSPWRTTAEVTFTSSSGNETVSIFTSELRIRREQTEFYGLDVRLRGRHGSRVEDGERERMAENYRVDLGVDLGSHRGWSPFVETRAEHDPFRRLRLRTNSGAGGKYTFSWSERAGRADASVALLHDYTARKAGDERVVDRNARWSFRVNGQQRLTEGITLSHTTEYRPVYDVLSEYLLNSETSVRVMLTDRIALSIGHELTRDSQPPPDVHKDDTLLKAGVMVQL
jgi:hypothetical protein